MTKQCTGAMIAGALVGACLAGSVGRAEAAPFIINITGSTGADGGVDFQLIGDTTATKGEFIYDENEQAPNFFDFLSTKFDDPNAIYRISNVSETTEFGLVIRSADFRVIDPNLSLTVSSSGGGTQTITGYDFTFHAEVPFYPPLGTYSEGIGSASKLLIPPASVVQDGQAFATGNPFVQTVPLPSGLPLLASGLAALGALGFTVRRRALAEAV